MMANLREERLPLRRRETRVDLAHDNATEFSASSSAPTAPLSRSGHCARTPSSTNFVSLLVAPSYWGTANNRSAVTKAMTGSA